MSRLSRRLEAIAALDYKNYEERKDLDEGATGMSLNWEVKVLYGP